MVAINMGNYNMYYTKTIITSEHSARYLQTLCRHFSRKVSVDWNSQHGEVNFAMGDCQFSHLSNTNQLELTCSADSLEKLATIKNILEQHITMLSRKETIELNWS
jgi:hypothetical protein